MFALDNHSVIPPYNSDVFCSHSPTYIYTLLYWDMALWFQLYYNVHNPPPPLAPGEKLQIKFSKESFSLEEL